VGIGCFIFFVLPPPTWWCDQYVHVHSL